MPPIRAPLLAALILAGALPALAQDDDLDSDEAREFFAALEADGRLSTAVRLIRASEATWFLERDDGDDEEYTLFAPTDDAFARLPAGALDALLLEENRVALTEILEHHLIPDDDVDLDDLEDGRALEPATGEDLEVAVAGDAVTVGGANVVATDIEVDDGVVHVIDAVLIPDLVRDALTYRGILPEEG